jgi:hypothetical protein
LTTIATDIIIVEFSMFIEGANALLLFSLLRRVGHEGAFVDFPL